MVVTASPVPLHTTFTALDVRIANTESKGRIRAAVSEFVDRHPDVHYFHSYEMVVTAERQSDYFREDGRHVHRHAVRYIVSEFLRLFADPALHLADVDTSWLTPIEKTAATVAPQPRPGTARAPLWRRAARNGEVSRAAERPVGRRPRHRARTGRRRYPSLRTGSRSMVRTVRARPDSVRTPADGTTPPAIRSITATSPA